jgi:iron complex transport system substrate-binding protein
MRVRAPLTLLSAIPLAMAALSGCGSADADPAASGSAAEDGAFPVTIGHTFGETTIDEQPERVVVLGWSAQDTVYALGLDPVGMPAYPFGGGDDGVLPWNDEHFDPEVTTLLDTALEPDVILAPYEGFDQGVYESLTGIAPTVAYPGKAWTTPWREQTRIIGAALGRTEEAEQLVAETDDRVAEIAASHPEFEGLTFAYTSMGAESLYLYLPTDPRVQLIEDLGFTVAPSVGELAAGAEESFYAELSLESAPDLEADVLVGFADGLRADEVAALPIYSQVPAIQRDSAVLIDDEAFAAAVSSVSVLSTRFVLDQLVEQLATAAARAGN